MGVGPFTDSKNCYTTGYPRINPSCHHPNEGMLYFEVRPRAGFVLWTGWVDSGPAPGRCRGKQVPNVLEGDLSLNATSGRATARA